MTKIELRHFAKWFVRDIVADIYSAVIAMLAWLFRAPIAAVKSHAEEYHDDPSRAWVRMFMICLIWIASVQAAAFLLGLAIAPDRAAQREMLTGALVGSTAILAVYMPSVLVTVKVMKFRSERQQLIESLSGSDQ